MIAILSDIHGNLEALTAVLSDAHSMNADEIICLGDIVGYGPNPCECIELAMSWDVVLRGDFEQALLETNSEWPSQLISMTNRLRDRIHRHPDGNDMISFVEDCPTIFKREFDFVHGSPRDHLNEYVFPEHVYMGDMLQSIFNQFDRACFCGHSHIPGLFYFQRDRWVFQTPNQLGDVFTIGDFKLLCNVGSVGQPRDEDPRACYVLLDGNHVVYRRIDYDYETTRSKIRDSDDDDLHGNRLPMGR